jgi:hypothetical protein
MKSAEESLLSRGKEELQRRRDTAAVGFFFSVLLGFVILFAVYYHLEREIGRRQRSEARLLHLNRLYVFLSETNQAIVWALVARPVILRRKGQGRKTTSHIGEIPKFDGVFHGISRAEGPFKQAARPNLHVEVQRRESKIVSHFRGAGGRDRCRSIAGQGRRRQNEDHARARLCSARVESVVQPKQYGGDGGN